MFAIAFAIAMIGVSSSDGAEGGPEPAPPVQVSTGDEQPPEQQEPAATESVASAPPRSTVSPPEQADRSGEPIQAQVSQSQPTTQQSQVIEPVTVEEPDPLSGFIIPIAGACVTEFEGHLPAAPRAYRNDGIHEGLDFYEWASCTTVNYDTPILAAKDGVVIRADLNYVDVTPRRLGSFRGGRF